MARFSPTYVRAGDTEPLELTASLVAADEVTSDNISAVVLYGRRTDTEALVFDGVACSVGTVTATLRSDGLYDVDIRLTFDPGDGLDLALTDTIKVECYARITWSDAETTRHPAHGGGLDLYVTPNFEPAA